MVAKSYIGLEQIGNPYKKNGRMYIKILTKKGQEKEVRWYTDHEFYTLYPEEKAKMFDKPWQERGCHRKVLGFREPGFITLLVGRADMYPSWLKEIGATYTRLWYWSISSDKPIPSKLPPKVRAVRLDWDKVGLENGDLRPEAEVREAVDALLTNYIAKPTFTMGESLDLRLICTEVSTNEGIYGTEFSYIFEDMSGAFFKWNTKSRELAEGARYHMRGTVKDFRPYNGSYVTVLTRCRILE